MQKKKLQNPINIGRVQQSYGLQLKSGLVELHQNNKHNVRVKGQKVNGQTVLLKQVFVTGCDSSPLPVFFNEGFSKSVKERQSYGSDTKTRCWKEQYVGNGQVTFDL